MTIWERCVWWWRRRFDPQVAVMGLVRPTLTERDDDGDIATWGITPIGRRCLEQEFLVTTSFRAAMHWIYLHYRHGRPCPLWIEDPRYPATRAAAGGFRGWTPRW